MPTEIKSSYKSYSHSRVMPVTLSRQHPHELGFCFIQPFGSSILAENTKQNPFGINFQTSHTTVQMKRQFVVAALQTQTPFST